MPGTRGGPEMRTRPHGLNIDRREADALDQVLAGCASGDLIMFARGEVPATAAPAVSVPEVIAACHADRPPAGQRTGPQRTRWTRTRRAERPQGATYRRRTEERGAPARRGTPWGIIEPDMRR